VKNDKVSEEHRKAEEKFQNCLTSYKSQGGVACERCRSRCRPKGFRVYSNGTIQKMSLKPDNDDYIPKVASDGIFGG